MTTEAGSARASHRNARIALAARGGVLALALAGLGGGLYLIAAVPPTPDSLYPKCAFYQCTGLHCPGCGTGRAIHFALNGSFEDAARSNAIAVVILPAIGLVAAGRTWRWLAGGPPRPRHLLAAGWIRLLLAVLTAFWILRNVPLEPFSLLAPREVSAAP